MPEVQPSVTARPHQIESSTIRASSITWEPCDSCDWPTAYSRRVAAMKPGFEFFCAAEEGQSQRRRGPDFLRWEHGDGHMDRVRPPGGRS